MKESLYEEKYKITKVCIDKYENRNLEGRIYQYNSEFGEGICFGSTIELLKWMEFIMETTNYPYFKACRVFQQAAEMEKGQPLPAIPKKGTKATFVLKILFRQHTSWQGTVMWCEKNLEERFRSVLELLLLMDSAVKE